MTETTMAQSIPRPARGKMLPGVAGIAMFLLFFTAINVFGALSNVYGAGRGKIGVLTICTLLCVGLFGLLKMRRWGWAIVLAGCLLLSAGDAWIFHLLHNGFFFVRSALDLVFFLYLVRPEVRDRMQ